MKQEERDIVVILLLVLTLYYVCVIVLMCCVKPFEIADYFFSAKISLGKTELGQVTVVQSSCECMLFLCNLLRTRRTD